jgi:hypothetical protein
VRPSKSATKRTFVRPSTYYYVAIGQSVTRLACGRFWSASPSNA